MKPPKICIIVVDGQSARFFDFPGRGKRLTELESHTLSADQVNEPADVQGTTHSSVGHSQHRMAPRSGPDKEKDGFAEKISSYLKDNPDLVAFEQFILIASPEMMGLLRDRLTAPVQDKIQAEIAKNFGGLSVEKIGKAVNDHLYG